MRMRQLMPQLPKYDPLDVPASVDQINIMRNKLEQSPIVANGYSVDCEPVSEERMRSTVTYWDDLPETEGVVEGTGSNRVIFWRLADNTVASFNRETLADLLSEMVKNRAIRSSILFTSAGRFKDNPNTTIREIQSQEAWGIVP